jgi:glutaredoxin
MQCKRAVMMTGRICFRDLLSLLCLCLVLLPGLVCAGDIYSWKDKDGNVHFGDRPPAQVQSKQVEIKDNTVTAPENVKNSSKAYVSSLGRDAPSKLHRKRKVVMYSAAWCGVCKRARKYFRQEHIPFKEFDIDKSASGRKAYEKYTTRSVPVIAVGKRHMKGFSPATFERFYAAASK